MSTGVVRVSSGTVLRFFGPLVSIAPAGRAALLDRSTSSDEEIRRITAAIIERVRRDGDQALAELARELDGVSLESLEVPRERCQSALDGLDRDVCAAMERSIRNIASVHRAFLPSAMETSPEPGIVVGRRPDPLGSVGVYAPGGRAAYPSSVLMGAVPARVAGVPNVIVCSPPGRDGAPSDVVLAAAALADVDRVFAIGGAGAIAAMSFGTATVPRVDRIVGPGNAYVAEAKLQVAGSVAIDSPAGPSELLVIADSTSDVEIVAREMIGQAEHDPRACVVAVVAHEETAHDLLSAIVRLLPSQPRRGIIEAALARGGAVLWTTTIDEAIVFANAYAPEHLLLALESADNLLRVVRNAGTVFVGKTASVAFGDYMTGANHVLPTGGLARSYSGLSVLDFIRWTTYQRVDDTAAANLAEPVAVFAEAEALPGHASAARAWARPGSMEARVG
jgi:histidinol dehydrogenase